MNSGMYKNAYTCGIPNSAFVGAAHAAALGYIAGDPEKGLEALENVTEENDREARRLVDEGRVTTEISGVHGINGLSPEDTMRNMGRIADPGMIETEKTILGIQAEKRV